MPRTLLAALVLASTSACGPATPAPAAEGAKESPSAEPAAGASPAEPAAAKPAPAGEASPMETLARDLLKSGGRRIAWSASKKRFVVPVEQRADGGRGLNLHFYDDEGNQREILKVCQPGECEDRLDELVKDLLPKLAARLSSEGFEAVSSVGWPSGQDEIEVGTLNAKLRQDKGGRISIVRDKKATPLRAMGGRTKGEISAVYPVSSAKLMGVLAGEFSVVKLP
jgi:hypothetical protein